MSANASAVLGTSGADHSSLTPRSPLARLAWPGAGTGAAGGGRCVDRPRAGRLRDLPGRGPRDWREKVEGPGELGGPPTIPDPPAAGAARGSRTSRPQPGAPQGAHGLHRSGPAGRRDLPGSRVRDRGAARRDFRPRRRARHGPRPARAARTDPPQLVATIPVDPTGGGGLTGLVLSPALRRGPARLRLRHHPARTTGWCASPAASRPKPVLTGIPRGATATAGRWASTPRARCWSPPGTPGAAQRRPARSPARCCASTRSGARRPGNPDPASPIYSSGLRAPAGICIDVR